MFEIELNALKCAICGLGVLEGGPMIGGSINNSIHPDCLLIDPFSDEVYTVEEVEFDVAKEVYEDNERFILSLYLEDLEF